MSADKLLNFKIDNITVIGLGYVGLPLAHALSKHFNVTGFDINLQRITELRSGIDKTGELSSEELKHTKITFSHEENCLSNSNFIIVTVPTPINNSKQPDLSPLISASLAIGRNLKPNTIIVYESTVYPGATEEVCVPAIEKASRLKWMTDFFIGYSPERINPGDKVHTVDKITKVVSGDCSESLLEISNVYSKVITAGVYKAASIKTAEAAKVIENTQRDLNIALMNELSIIFNKLGIDTHEVLKAASTKWNFLNFFPGLVGGHCIGVDPYYLTHKAESIGYLPEVILAGRRINDQMGTYVANQVLKLVIKNKKLSSSPRILICGFTFKENVPDIRNTKVIDIYNELIEYKFQVDIFDPVASVSDAHEEYGLEIINDHSFFSMENYYDAIILAVPHDIILKNLTLEKMMSIQTENPILVDCRGVYRESISNTFNKLRYFSL